MGEGDGMEGGDCGVVVVILGVSREYGWDLSGGWAGEWKERTNE